VLTFDAADALGAEFDACVVGAGPGRHLPARSIFAARGVKVLSAGGRTAKSPVPGDPDLLAAEIAHPEHHDPTDIVAAHALGGSSHWWGGRSVPFEAVGLRRRGR
jgi:hypothetical protein